MRRKISDAFDRVASEERAFLGSEFVAPVVSGQRIVVRIAGIVCNMAVQPHSFTGWGVFQASNRATAVFLRHPRMSDRAAYMKMHPGYSLVVSGRKVDQWYGRTANAGSHIVLNGDAPIQLADGIQIFDTVRTRFDGGTFWFERRDSTRGPHANYLRQALNDLVHPEALEYGGLHPPERAVYGELHALRLAEIAEANRDKTEDRLRGALAHAGAVLQGYREVADRYTVEYTVDGARHTSVVQKDLTVQSAGICLSGGDRAFDLTSLVGVIREGEARDRIVRVGLNTGPHGEELDYDDGY